MASGAVALARPAMAEALGFDLGPLVPGGEPVRVAADLHWPAQLAERPLLLVCVPGGGVTRRYFDLQAPDGEPFSFAEPMLAAGHALLTIDPPGVGESTRPADGFTLLPEVLAQAHHAVVEQALTRLRASDGVPAFVPVAVIGVGHSAGAMIQLMQQATFGDYAAMLLFCFGQGGLPHRLDEAERAALDTPDRGRARLAEFARRRFDGVGYIPAPFRDDDKAAARALRAVHDQVIAVVGEQAMMPGSTAAEAAAIDVPLFLAVGDRDMTGPPADLGAAYRACPDFTLHVVPTSGHHVFVAPTASRLYDRVAGWLDMIAKGRL